VPTVAIAAVGLVVVAGAFFALQPKAGSAKVFVTGTGGKPLDKYEVSVDGAKRCEGAPCALTDLEKGARLFKVVAAGYAPWQDAVTIRAGEEIAISAKLTADKPAEKAGTGVHVAAGTPEGTKLFIDGKEFGALPRDVKDLAPGEHKLSFRAGDRYSAEEKTVTVAEGELASVSAPALKVVRGLATLDVRTAGAQLTLVSGTDRRALTDTTKPLELDASKPWTLEAKKPGFDDLSLPLSFDDRAEKTFVVSLAEKGKPVAAAPAAPVAAAPAEKTAAPSTDTAKAPKPAETKGGNDAAGGNCTLNINSIPVSNVVLDGRPLGGTPKMGVSVSAGAHSVTFIHAEHGKKTTGVTCKAGETKTVAQRLGG
jgi:serine/threonine-protein kinase